MFVTDQHRIEVATQDQFHLSFQDECVKAMTANETYQQNEIITIYKVHLKDICLDPTIS